MRSFYASMLALALTVLLCACVSNVPVWETVDAEIVQPVAARRPSSIVFAIPEGAVRETFAQDSMSQVYSAPDGSYEITATVFDTADPDAAIALLTGFDASQLQIVTTTRFSLPEYQFAWCAAADSGERLFRASVLCDEQYCYALCFSRPAASGTDYDSTCESVFATFGLYFDETQ